jgi:diguanylate cyclase (GGDEF)-like protein
MSHEPTEMDLLLEKCWDSMVSQPEATLKTLVSIKDRLDISDELNGKALFYTGCCLVYNGDYKAAIEELNAAVALAHTTRDLHQIRRVNNIIGTAYKSLGEYGKAVYAFDFAIQLSKELEFPDGQIVAQLNLINLYYDVGDFDACEQQLNEVLALDYDNTNQEWLGEIHLVEARMFMLQFDFTGAMSAIKKALVISESIQYNHLRINSLIQQGRLLRLKGRLHDAIQVLKNAHADPGFPYEGVAGLVCDVELAKAWLSLGDYEKAHLLLTEAMALLEGHSNDHHFIRLQLNELMALCLQQSGQFEDAFTFLQRTMELKNTVNNERIRRTLEIKKQKQAQENERIQQSITERENRYLKTSQHQLKIINKVAIELASTLQLSEIGEKLYVLMKELFDAHFISLALYDRLHDTAVFRVIIDDGELQPTYCLPMSTSDSRVVQTMLKGEPLTVGDQDIIIRSGRDDLKPVSQLFLPLIQDANMIGVLSVQSTFKNRFKGDDLELIIALSPFITLALTNALSHEQLNELNDELVREKQIIEQAQNQINFMAHHDSLTSLPNRRALEGHLDELVKSDVSSESFSLVYIDLDGFKPVNDVHGHIVGDKVLQVISERINSVLRKTDFGSRVGGDEFVLVLHSITDHGQLTALINRVLKSIEEPIAIDELTLHLSASIGVVDYGEKAKTLDELMHFADQAMYDVKRAGKGGIKFHS